MPFDDEDLWALHPSIDDFPHDEKPAEPCAGYDEYIAQRADEMAREYLLDHPEWDDSGPMFRE